MSVKWEKKVFLPLPRLERFRLDMQTPKAHEARCDLSYGVWHERIKKQLLCELMRSVFPTYTAHQVLSEAHVRDFRRCNK